MKIVLKLNYTCFMEINMVEIKSEIYVVMLQKYTTTFDTIYTNKALQNSAFEKYKLTDAELETINSKGFLVRYEGDSKKTSFILKEFDNLY